MSYQVQAWAIAQRLKPTPKLVLMCLANRANPDNGMAVFPKVQTIANEVGVDVRTVQRHLAELVKAGLVRVDKRLDARGYQTSNSYVFPAFAECGGAPRPERKSAAPPKGSPAASRAASAPEPVSNKNVTPATAQMSPPSNFKDNLFPPKELRSFTPVVRKGHRIPEAWTPPRADWLPPKAKDCAERWPEGAYETEADSFRCRWEGESGYRAYTLDWDKRWAKHVVRETSRIVRDAKVVNYSSNRTESLTALVNDIATIGPDGKRGKEELEATGEEEGEAEAIRRHLKHRIGDASFGSWFSRCEIEVQGGEVFIRAKSNVIADGIRDRFAADVRRACLTVLGSRFSRLDVPSVARAVTPSPRRSGWEARLG